MTTRAIGLACVAAAAVWLAGWFGSLFTEEGSRTFLSLGEVGWRRFVSLPILAFAALVWAVRRRVRGRLVAGVWLSLLALALMFVGNVLEVGVRGGVWIGYGWGVFIIGGLIGVPGFVLLGIALARDATPPRLSRFAYAVGTLLFVIPLFSVTVGVAWLLWGAALALEPTRHLQASGAA